VSLTPIFWVAVAILCGGCAAPAEPEAQVREVIRQAEQAAEARDLRKMRTLVADAYLDVRGNDKPALENLLRLVFLAHQSVHLVIYVESIEFPSAAVAEVVALVGMADTAAALPDVDLYQFEVQLASQGDGEWQLIDADWRRGLGKAPGE
jgi:hypothetical protein